MERGVTMRNKLMKSLGLVIEFMLMSIGLRYIWGRELMLFELMLIIIIISLGQVISQLEDLNE
jgi:hypothetical protein